VISQEDQAPQTAPPPYLLVKPTKPEQRRKSKSDYIACINKSVKKDRGLGEQVALSRPVENDPAGRELVVRCQLVESEAIPDGEVWADQTVRNAIGIEFGDETEKAALAPIQRGPMEAVREHVSRLLGRRFVLLRVCKADPPDLEKDIARISPEIFALLGIRPGDRMFISCPVPRSDGPGYDECTHTLRANELPEQMLAERERNEEDEAKLEFQARYLSAKRLVGVKRDIGRIFLDEEARSRLGNAAPLQVVKVRRASGNAVGQELLGFGVVFFISGFAVSSVLPWGDSWLKTGVIVAIAAVATAIFVVINLRSRPPKTG
jgi:hypothetical protein